MSQFGSELREKDEESKNPDSLNLSVKGNLNPDDSLNQL
jgi:hypothetical protein